MNRLWIFKSLNTHHIFRASMRKLSEKDRLECEAFIKENDELTYEQFNAKAVRWFMDGVKPVNHGHMYAVVVASNPIPKDWRKK